MSDAPVKKKSRLEWLDVTRGIASIIVLFQHLLEQQVASFKHFTWNYINLGQMGVSAFFLVSGFVIPYSLERSGSLKKFWISRFFRLFPLYWASLFAALGLGAIGLKVFGVGFDPNNPAHVGLNLTMIQGLLKKPHAIDVYWTLSLEMFFYGLVTFLFITRLNKKSFQALIGFGCIILLLGVVAPHIIGRRLPVGGSLFYILTALFGTLVFRYLQGDETKDKVFKALGFLLFVEASLCITIEQFKDRSPSEIVLPPIAMFLSAFAGYLLFFSVFAFRNHKMSKPLLHLGMVSYSVYLLHPFIVHLMPMTEYPALNLVLAIAAIWALSTVSFHLIEKPFQKLGRRFAGA